MLPERTDNFTGDPRPPVPNGWWGIAYSDEMPAGGILSRHILGRDLVLYRGESGALTVAGAYCPHLGAHLGGGEMVGECLQCPFHHWQFDADGRCAHIPYGTNRPDKARLDTWRCREINGFVFVWYDAAGREPGWDIPEHGVPDDPGYYLAEKRRRVFDGHPQDISENGADFSHFVAIHGWDQVKLKFEPSDYYYRVGYDTGEVDTGYGDVGDVGVDSKTVGPGYSYTHYTGQYDWLMITCWTPVDPNRLYMQHLYYMKNDIPRHQAVNLINAVDEEWRADISIWESKRYNEHPALNDGDGPIARFRRWYAQFYD